MIDPVDLRQLYNIKSAISISLSLSEGELARGSPLSGRETAARAVHLTPLSGQGPVPFLCISPSDCARTAGPLQLPLFAKVWRSDGSPQRPLLTRESAVLSGEDVPARTLCPHNRTFIVPRTVLQCGPLRFRLAPERLWLWRGECKIPTPRTRHKCIHKFKQMTFFMFNIVQ